MQRALYAGGRPVYFIPMQNEIMLLSALKCNEALICFASQMVL